ncbi:MAG: tetratricopeptide repeat protein [Thermodesulfobacteriota bacterium]|nr:tetratricopeptide repeat protein [Thermodesulfobacteriota bacterium]
MALFELAEVYTVLNQFETAMRYYTLAAEDNAMNVLPHRRMAQICLHRGKLLEARTHVENLFKVDPYFIPGFLLMAEIQVKERDLDAALDTLKQAEAVDSENIDIQLRLADIYSQQNDVKNMEAALKKAVAVDPSARQACLNLADLYLSLEKPEKAESLLIGIVETPGEEGRKHMDLARFYELQNQMDKAAQVYEKAVQAAPFDVSVKIGRARFYARQNMKDAALAEIKQALSLEKESLDVLTEAGRIYLHFGMLQAAQAALYRVLQKDDTFVDALFEQGRVFMAQKNYKRALEYIDTAITLDAPLKKRELLARAYYLRALCIEAGGAADMSNQKIFRAAAGMLDDPQAFETDQVKASLMAAAALEPSLTPARIRLVEIFLMEKEAEKAREQITEILKYQSFNLKLLTLQAAVYILEGNFAAAEEILTQMASRNPDHIPTYVRLGALSRAMGKKDQALDLLSRAREKAPDQLGLIKMMADIYVADKKYDAAMDMVTLLSGESDSRAGAFFENLKGEISMSRGDMETALTHFEAAVAQNPDYVKARLNAAGLCLRSRKTQRALDHYKAVEILDPGHVQTLMAIGFIHDTAGRYDMAEGYYRKVLEIAPDHANAANNLAFILSQDTGSLDEALRLASMARVHMPKSPNVLDTLGWIYYLKGNYLTARSELEESLSLYPDNAMACFHYGMTLYHLKEYEKARSFLNRALSLNPSFTGAELMPGFFPYHAGQPDQAEPEEQQGGRFRCFAGFQAGGSDH